MVAEQLLLDPDKKEILNQLEVFTQDFINSLNAGRLLDTTYIIPVVVHVVHEYEQENISYDQIDHGILRINEDFNALNDDLSNLS